MEWQIRALIKRIKQTNEIEEKRIKWGDGDDYSRGILAANESTIRELRAILEMEEGE